MLIDSSTVRSTQALLLSALLLACGGGEGEGVTRSAEAPVELDGASLAAQGATSAAKGFDLLIVTLDTVRADHLGCNGYARAKTPVIDGLAAKGINFREAFASAPITLPSHATLFTGLSPLSHGVRNNGTFRLEETHQTLAESLQSEGYRTGAFIGAYVLDARYGLDQGFDHYDDDTNPNDLGRVSGHFNERSAALVTDAALAWHAQESPDDKPLFTWVHYFDAHAPYDAPGSFGTDFKQHPYDGEIAFLDFQVGRLIEGVRASGRLQKTLVVITSDHGEGLGEHGEETHSRLLYDSTLRVPLIFSAPALFDQAGTVTDRVASLEDVTPTLLDLLGLQVPLAVTGEHLFQGTPREDRSIYMETLVPLFNHGWAPLQGLHRRADKFVSAPRPEYFDVQGDPGELSNLFASSPSEALALRGELARLLAGQASALALAQSEGNLSAADAKRLAALGYTRGQSGGPVGQLDPKDMMPIWKAMNAASDLSVAGQHSLALKKIKQVLEESPEDAYALDTAALIYARMGRNPDAERFLHKSLKRAPTAEGFVRLAQLQLARTSFSEMEQALGRAEALDPQEGGIFMVRGDAYASQARWPEALASFRKALEVDAVKWSAEAQSKIRAVEARTR